MNTLPRRLIAAACAIFAAALLMGAAALQRSEDQMGIVLLTTSESVAYQVNNSSALPANLRMYNEVCWKNMGTDSSKYVLISTFSTVDESRYGWPVLGTEKECHDWAPNIPLFVFANGGDGAQTTRFMFSK